MMTPMFELKNLVFFTRLKALFEAEGFEYIPVQNQFKKYTESGFYNVILSPTWYGELVYFELHFGARINLVEDTISPYSHGLRGYKEESNTCITNLGKYLEKPFYKLKASSPQEVRSTGDYIYDFFQREGLAFLYSLSDLAKVEHAFNAAPHKESVLAFNHELRCFRGITLAALTQSHAWERVHQAYQAYFEQRKSPLIIRENYQRLVSFLTNMGLN